MNKIFKKCCLALACLLLAGCGTGQQQKTYTPTFHNWRHGDAAFKETCTYSVTYKPFADAEHANKSITVEYYPESALTVTVETVSGEAEHNADYKLTAVYALNGKYKLTSGAKTLEFEDRVTNTVWFCVKSGVFAPVRSEQHAVSTVPTGANPSDPATAFATLDYHYSIDYSDDEASSEFVLDDKSDAAYFNLADGEKKTADLGNNFVDINMLFFFPRALEQEAAVSYSFTTIDVLGGTVSHNMAVAGQSLDAVGLKNVVLTPSSVGYLGSAEIKDGEPTGDYVLSANALTLNVGLNETYNGSPITCTYIANKNYYNYMSRMETALPFSIGSLVYDLARVELS